MADDIEDLERKMQSNLLYATISEFLPFFLTPKTATDLTPQDGLDLEDRQEQVSRLAKLPEFLHAYADDLKTRLKMATRYDREGKTLFRRVWPVQLIRAVETATGDPHWREVATLLTASYEAVGCDRQADPKALAMQRSRFDSKKPQK
jgi:hypothetical protein